MGPELGSRVRPKRSKIVELYTNPPPEATVVCVDELGPVSPRTFPPAPGWSPDGHRIKAPLEYSRGWDKVWVFGALRVEDGKKSLTFTSRSRNSKGYLRLLKKIEEDRASSPTGSYLPDRRQSKDPRQRPGEEVARRASEGRARFHPEGSGMAQPHRGLVAYFPTTGLCRTVLCG